MNFQTYFAYFLSLLATSTQLANAQHDPLEAWHWQMPHPTSTDLHTVLHNGTHFVAVGPANGIFKSTDGGNRWQTAGVMIDLSLPSPDLIPIVGFYSWQGLYCSTDSKGNACASSDGFHWQVRSNAFQGNRTQFAECAGKLLLSGAPLLVSSNGLDWIRSGSINTESIAGDGTSALALTAGKKLFRSIDASTWIDITPTHPSWPSITGISHAHDLWIAAGLNEVLFTSEDGIQWKLGFGPLTGGQTLITKSTLRLQGSYWIRGRTNWFQSSLGTQWTKSLSHSVPAIARQNPLAISSDGTTAVAVGAGGAVMTSTNLIDWNRVGPSPAKRNYHGIFFCKDTYFTATLLRRDPLTFSIAESSTNLADWTPIQLPTGFRARAFAYGNGVYVAVGQSTNSRPVLVAQEPHAWSEAFFSLPFDVNYVTFSQGAFIAASPRGLVTSKNGTNWVASAAPRTHYEPNSCTTFNQRTYLGTSTGSILSSADLKTWREEPFSLPSGAVYIGHLGNSLVRVFNGVSAVSQDLIQWTTNSIPFLGEGSIATAAQGSDYMVFWSYSGTLRFSRNGTHWNRTRFLSETPAGSCFANGKFVMNTTSGSILESDPILFLALDSESPRHLWLYGTTGSYYNINISTNVDTSASWQTWRTMRMDSNPMLLHPPFSPQDRSVFLNAQQVDQ